MASAYKEAGVIAGVTGRDTAGRSTANIVDIYRAERAAFNGKNRLNKIAQEVRSGIREVTKITPTFDLFSENDYTESGNAAGRAIKYGVDLKTSQMQVPNKGIMQTEYVWISKPESIWLDAELALTKEQFPLNRNYLLQQRIMAEVVDDLYPQVDSSPTVSSLLGLNNDGKNFPREIEISQVDAPYDSMKIIIAGSRRVYIKDGRVMDDKSEEVKDADKRREFKAWVESLNTVSAPIIRHETRLNLVPPDSEKVGFDGLIGKFGTMDKEVRQEEENLLRLAVDNIHGVGFYDKHKNLLIYDPEVTGRDYDNEKDPVLEARALIKNIIILHVLMGKLASIGVGSEAGTIALASAVFQRETYGLYADLPPRDQITPPVDEKEYANILLARQILQVNARYYQKIIPDFKRYEKPEQLKQLIQEAVVSREKTIQELTQHPGKYQVTILPERPTTIEKRMSISGSSKKLGDPGYREIIGAIDRNHVIDHWQKRGFINGREYYDTKINKVDTEAEAVNPWKVKEWDINFYENTELPLMNDSLINVHLVNDATSYGTQEVISAAIVRAAMNRTYAVIALPPHLDKNGKEIRDTYSRARALPFKQFEALAAIVPGVRRYVRFVETEEELIATTDAIWDAANP